MSKFSNLGNDLYSGERSIDFVGKFRTWLLISAVLMLIVALGVGIRGFNFGIEFTGGSDFRVAGVSNTEGYDSKARDAVAEASGVTGALSQVVGGDTVRVQTERMDEDSVRGVTAALSTAFEVPAQNVSSSVIGPSWGESVSRQALQALVVFLVLVSIVLALYFRTWKMSFAALVALAHDVILTVGVYALAGFEITPASAIGFLTILGYSLYDTVVVFDKVRENTDEAIATHRQTFAEAANLAVNQTLIRSINTTIVAILPVAAVLVVGIVLIGPGTLLDLSLSLFIGIALGNYSSLFIATPLLVWMRRNEPEMKQLQANVEERRRRLAAAGHPVDARGLPTGVRRRVPSWDQGSAPDPETGVAGAATAPSEDPEALGSTENVEGAEPVLATAARRTATGRPVHPSMLPQEEAPRRGRRRRGDRGDQA